MSVPIQIPWDLFQGKIAVWCDLGVRLGNRSKEGGELADAIGAVAVGKNQQPMSARTKRLRDHRLSPCGAGSR